MQAIHDFFSAWALTDAGAQAEAIAKAFAPDGTYADPMTPEPLAGHAAIAGWVSNFAANAPGWSARVLQIDTVAGAHRAAVSFEGPGPDGTTMAQTGQYFVTTTDSGQIRAAVGFKGLGTPE